MSDIWGEEEYFDSGETEEVEMEEVEFMDYTPTEEKANFAYELNKGEGDVMQHALVQLEQAKLYDMFLKHKLFDGIKANPKALKNVEKELKDFILGRLQVLLGIKKEQDRVETVQHVELPFNQTEIDFLKALAYKGTKGQSVTDRPAIAPITPIAQKTTQSLKPIKKQEESKVIPREEVKVNKNVKKIVKKVVNYNRPKKSVYEMTPQEQKELNDSLNVGKKIERPANALPLPDDNQLIAHLTAQAMSSSTNKDNALMGVLRQKLGGGVMVGELADD